MDPGGPLCGCDGCEMMRRVLGGDVEELTESQTHIGGRITEMILFDRTFTSAVNAGIPTPPRLAKWATGRYEKVNEEYL